MKRLSITILILLLLSIDPNSFVESYFIFSFVFLFARGRAKVWFGGIDRTKYVAYFGPHFLSFCIVFVYFCVTYGLDMCDCRHLSIFGVEIKILDFRAKRGLKVQKRAELGNKCGLVRFPTALDPHFVPNPRPWKNRARAIVQVSASKPTALHLHSFIKPRT